MLYVFGPVWFCVDGLVWFGIVWFSFGMVLFGLACLIYFFVVSRTLYCFDAFWFGFELFGVVGPGLIIVLAWMLLVWLGLVWFGLVWLAWAGVA